MNQPTDPMLGNAEEQQAYIAKIMETVEDEIKADEQNRKLFASRRYTDEQSPVLLGATGFGDGPMSV